MNKITHAPISESEQDSLAVFAILMFLTVFSIFIVGYGMPFFATLIR